MISFTADKGGHKQTKEYYIICPADSSGSNILYALGRENVQRAASHDVHSSYVGLLSDFVERSGRLRKTN